MLKNQEFVEKRRLKMEIIGKSIGNGVILKKHQLNN
jgi:hypothetical protein